MLSALSPRRRTAVSFLTSPLHTHTHALLKQSRTTVNESHPDSLTQTKWKTPKLRRAQRHRSSSPLSSYPTPHCHHSSSPLSLFSLLPHTSWALSIPSEPKEPCVHSPHLIQPLSFLFFFLHMYTCRLISPPLCPVWSSAPLMYSGFHFPCCFLPMCLLFVAPALSNKHTFPLHTSLYVSAFVCVVVCCIKHLTWSQMSWVNMQRRGGWENMASDH